MVKYNLILKTATSSFAAVIVFIFCLFNNFIKAQENVITLGFQFKPIVPIKYFFTEGAELSQNGYKLTINQKFGTSWGMVIRRGYTKRLSLETGISYVGRRYSLEIEDSLGLQTNDKFTVVAYEIPLQGLVYIQLTDKLYMNVALGMSVDVFPSDIYTENQNYQHYSQRKSWVLPGVSANLGYEYRTEKWGYFYLGASYHRPFSSMYTSVVEIDRGNGALEKFNASLAGNYLTVDFRYFLHSDPLKEKMKKKKKSE